MKRIRSMLQSGEERIIRELLRKIGECFRFNFERYISIFTFNFSRLFFVKPNVTQIRVDGEEAALLREIHRGVSVTATHEVGEGADHRAGPAHLRLHQHLRARRPNRVEPRPGRDQGLHPVGFAGAGASRGHEPHRTVA